MKCYLRKDARAELNEAALYYEEMREDLGDEFIEDFLLGITEIEEAPARWPQIYLSVRRFRMSKFPYAIFYRQLTESVEIIAISHQARTDYWKTRLQ